MAKVSDRRGFWSFFGSKWPVFRVFFDKKARETGFLVIFGPFFGQKTTRRICEKMRKSCGYKKTPSLDDFWFLVFFGLNSKSRRETGFLVGALFSGYFPAKSAQK